MLKHWLTAKLVLTTGLAFAGPGGDTTPQVEFKKPAESVELFQQEAPRESKPEPAVQPDSKTKSSSVDAVGGSEILARSAIESLEKLEKARQLLELADLLASTGDLKQARVGYEEIRKLCPGSRYDGIAVTKLESLTAQELVGAGEAEAGLSLTGEVCWNVLSQTDPTQRLIWLDRAFAAYSKAIDEKNPKETAIYRQVIEQLSPETAKHLIELKRRELDLTIRWKIVSVRYTKKLDGQQSLGLGLGLGGK